DRALDVVAPHFARQFVEHLDAVAVGVDDVEAVRHAVIDAALELDAPRAQPSQLLQPRLAVRHGDRDVVDRDRLVAHRPFRRRFGQVRVLAQCDVVVVHAAVVVARIKAQLRRFEYATCLKPRVSVQNLCDSSMSRTLMTMWLTPRGVTASSGVAGTIEDCRPPSWRNYAGKPWLSMTCIPQIYPLNELTSYRPCA